MSALTILIIRHAEKPGEMWPGPGLTPDGVSDPQSLVVRGWQRAGAWAALFTDGRGGVDYPGPDVIYAADPNAPGEAGDVDADPSHRPFETIKPLADRLNLAPVTTFAQGQEVALAAEVTQRTGVALVCWEHKKIIKALLPAIAPAGDPDRAQSRRYPPGPMLGPWPAQILRASGHRRSRPAQVARQDRGRLAYRAGGGQAHRRTVRYRARHQRLPCHRATDGPPGPERAAGRRTGGLDARAAGQALAP